MFIVKSRSGFHLGGFLLLRLMSNYIRFSRISFLGSFLEYVGHEYSEHE